ncbi:MAG TPA: LamG domain-containing protein, partial [Geminicoccaceae bacterium]|nr:LamG domain-containing protein [Geminicoccaceae bacterium]
MDEAYPRGARAQGHPDGGIVQVLRPAPDGGAGSLIARGGAGRLSGLYTRREFLYRGSQSATLGWLGIGMLLRAYFGSIASIAELDEYTAAVDGLPGGPPLAHWRLGQPSGSFFERKAGRHATPLGTIIRNVPGLPQASDDAAYFAGTGSAEVAHDPGLELAALSLSFWVIVHSLHDSNTAVISKDQSGFVMGDFAVYLTSDNLMGVLFQDGGAQYTITAPISLGTKYHVCVRADHTGFDYYLNAQFVGKNTSFTDAWSSNTQPLRLASVPWSSNLSDVTLDEICLFERVLTEAEIAQLAQRTDAPVAEPDLFNVPEESSTVLDVLANDKYLGHKSNLTIELWNGSSWTDTVSTAHGTASVRADKDIEFVAGSVDGDQSDGFQYRI